MQLHNFFWPSPLGTWGGVKRSNIIKFQLHSQFQRFLYQTLCVFPQMKDIKHIKHDFYYFVCVMPQGLGTGGAQGVKKNWEHGHVAYQIDGDDEHNRMQGKI